METLFSEFTNMPETMRSSEEFMEEDQPALEMKMQTGDVEAAKRYVDLIVEQLEMEKEISSKEARHLTEGVREEFVKPLLEQMGYFRDQTPGKGMENIEAFHEFVRRSIRNRLRRAAEVKRRAA